MTYPIPPRPSFRSAPNWGKPAKHFLFLKTLQKGQTSSIAAASPQWGKPSNLWTPCVYSLRPWVPSWICIRWIQYASHRNNFKLPPALAISTATQNTAPNTAPNTATSSLGNIFWRHSRFSPQTTRTTHSWATTSFLSLTSKHDLRYTYGDHTSLTHSAMPKPNDAHFAQTFSC